MVDSTKTLIGALAGIAGMIAIFALMADCSKAVSRTGSEAVEACVRSGGAWIGSNDGVGASLDYCQPPEPRK